MNQEIKERVEKIRKGEVPEGYKATKVGIVPNEWEEKMFNDIIFDFRGGAPLTPNDFKDNGIKVLPKRGVTRGGILVIEKDKMQYCSSQYAENHETNLVDNTYTIIVLRDLVPSGPNIGLMVKIDSNDNFILAQGVYGFKVKDESVSSHFLIHLSNGNGYRKLMNNIMVGSTQVHITNTTFLKLHIPLPSSSDQEIIAEILSTWDKAIELKEKLIEEKKEFKRGLMQKLLTRKMRFPEFTGDWKKVVIGDVFEDVKRINENNSKDIDILTISAKHGFLSQKDKFNRVIAGSSLKKYTHLFQNEFAYNKGNSKTAPFGCIFKLDAKEGMVPFVYICFRPTQMIDVDYFDFYFKHGLLDRQLKRIITSGARSDGLLNVSKDNFFNIKISLPSIEEQKKIGLTLKLIQNKIDYLADELNQLKEQKKGLMQLLLTGIVRVEVD